MNPLEVNQMAGRVSQLLAERLGARGRNLQERIESRARALPRKVRAAARALAEAEAQAAVPKLARQIDATALRRAYHTCHAYLAPLGQTSRLWRGFANLAASVLFALFVLGALGFALMR